MILCYLEVDFGHSNSGYNSRVLFCVDFIVVCATVDIVQWYSFLLGGY